MGTMYQVEVTVGYKFKTDDLPEDRQEKLYEDEVSILEWLRVDPKVFRVRTIFHVVEPRTVQIGLELDAGSETDEGRFSCSPAQRWPNQDEIRLLQGLGEKLVGLGLIEDSIFQIQVDTQVF